jgi:CheY-like chemotaxis protein
VERIVIPGLLLDTIVKYVPYDGYSWMINGLRDEVAWMGNTSWPGLGSNTGLAGHVTVAGYGDGPFRHLDELLPGDVVVLYTEKNSYTYHVRESRITGLQCGADDFISKPFDATELIIKVSSLIKLKTLQDELEHSENVILTLAVAMEARDPYTKGHSTRVGDLSRSFAAFLGFGSREQEAMRKAGVLHDIGKIGVTTDLLCKEVDELHPRMARWLIF